MGLWHYGSGAREELLPLSTLAGECRIYGNALRNISRWILFRTGRSYCTWRRRGLYDQGYGCEDEHLSRPLSPLRWAHGSGTGGRDQIDRLALCELRRTD